MASPARSTRRSSARSSAAERGRRGRRGRTRPDARPSLSGSAPAVGGGPCSPAARRPYDSRQAVLRARLGRELCRLRRSKPGVRNTGQAMVAGGHVAGEFMTPWASPATDEMGEITRKPQSEALRLDLQPGAKGEPLFLRRTWRSLRGGGTGTLNRRDVEGLIDLCADDFLMGHVRARVQPGHYRGRQDLRRFYEGVRSVWETLPTGKCR